MARRVIAGIMLTWVAALSVAGCSGGSDDGSEGNAKKNGPEVAWAAKFCDAVGRGGGKVQLPTFTNPKDAKSVKAGYLTFLESLAAQLKAVETSLQGAGAPPVDGGSAALTKAVANLKAAETTLAKATQDMRGAKTTNMKAFQQTVAKLSRTMQAHSGYEGPVKDLRANPKLSVAFDNSPSCTSRRL